MSANSNPVWENAKTQQFAEALASIADIQTMQNLLRDVMTEKEIIEISARLEAARMLQAGSKYTDIIAKTKLSSRTIARISEWLRSGTGGYKVALKTISTHHEHLPPVRAE